METPGARIKAARELRGWSQADLGRRVTDLLGRPSPIGKAAVNKWEAGTTRLPEADALVVLAKLFDTTPELLLWGPDRKPPGERRRLSTPERKPPLSIK